MDRMIWLAMSGAKQTLTAQAAANHNLANASTAGFRADFNAFRALPVFGDGHPSRVYAMSERPGVDFKAGSIVRTGNDLDVAVDGEGWLAVQAPDGSEAYTRAGNLRLDAGGLLQTASGHPVLGNGGAIAIPPSETLNIGNDGTISVRPVGQGSESLATVDRLRLVHTPSAELVKGPDGLFRRSDGQPAAPDASVRVVQGAYESSNVNPIEMMVSLMNMQRQFELQVKAMRTAQENDAQSAQLLRLA